MMPFAPDYASAYDTLYAEKDYAGECDLLEEVFHRFAPTAVHRVLDMGCGTGGHSLILAARGYEVTGIDRAPAMLDAARAKAGTSGVAVTWIEDDIRTAA